jgi:hypothetical protein
VVVLPWADVSVDGIPVGQTPLTRIPLAPGPHSLVLTHPKYQPFTRKFLIQEGATLRLEVNLEVDAVRRR